MILILSLSKDAPPLIQRLSLRTTAVTPISWYEVAFPPGVLRQAQDEVRSLWPRF
jgi:hypothetical protein